MKTHNGTPSLLVIAAAVVLLGGGVAAAQTQPTAAEILSRVDANVSFTTIRYTGRMDITINGETRSKTMNAAAQGVEKAFAEFTNPEDSGTRFLKLGKDLWMWFPKEADTVKISGHLLKEGIMGSDVSYEDALESRNYAALYNATVKGKETVDGRDCWVVELVAKAVTAPYDRRVLWIDAERWVDIREEMYARSGRLLKTSHTLQVEKIGERWFPMRTELVSVIRKDSRTVFSMDKVEINAALDPRQFTMAALTK